MRLFAAVEIGEHLTGRAEDLIRELERRCAVAAPRARVTRTAYNLSAFNPTAQEIHDIVSAAFPRATIGWAVDRKRQGIVDSWPADVDDAAARRDWGFSPRYDLASAFTGYLIPTIRARYRRA